MGIRAGRRSRPRFARHTMARGGSGAAARREPDARDARGRAARATRTSSTSPSTTGSGRCELRRRAGARSGRGRDRVRGWATTRRGSSPSSSRPCAAGRAVAAAPACSTERSSRWIAAGHVRSSFGAHARTASTSCRRATSPGRRAAEPVASSPSTSCTRRRPGPLPAAVARATRAARRAVVGASDAGALRLSRQVAATRGAHGGGARRRVGGARRQGRAVDLSARAAHARVAQAQAGQTTGVRRRRLDRPARSRAAASARCCSACPGRAASLAYVGHVGRLLRSSVSRRVGATARGPSRKRSARSMSCRRRTSGRTGCARSSSPRCSSAMDGRRDLRHPVFIGLRDVDPSSCPAAAARRGCLPEAKPRPPRRRRKPRARAPLGGSRGATTPLSRRIASCARGARLGPPLAAWRRRARARQPQEGALAALWASRRASSCATTRRSRRRLVARRARPTARH
jgi:hypothetical protein